MGWSSPERRREYNREYLRQRRAEDPAFREAYNEYQRQWRLDHQDLVRARDRDRIKGRIIFQGKQIQVGAKRTGICSKCGKNIKGGEIKVTHLHHDKYDALNPLAHTRELCNPCHRKTHAEVRDDS